MSPPELVVTFCWATNTSASPWLDASADTRNSWMVNSVLGTLLSDPVTKVAPVPPFRRAELSTGKFWR